MAQPYCYEYPRPAVTVDLVTLCRVDNEIRVLLIQRKHAPFAGRWALPGGFLDLDETAEHAARRELREETGVALDTPIEFLGVFDDPKRDPRGRTISLVYTALLEGPEPRAAGSDDAEVASWHRLDAIRDLAFDHDQILAHARRWLAARV